MKNKKQKLGLKNSIHREVDLKEEKRVEKLVSSFLGERYKMLAKFLPRISKENDLIFLFGAKHLIEKSLEVILQISGHDNIDARESRFVVNRSEMARLIARKRESECSDKITTKLLIFELKDEKDPEDRQNLPGVSNAKTIFISEKSPYQLLMDSRIDLRSFSIISSSSVELFEI